MKDILMRCWKNNRPVALYRDAADLNGFDCCKIILVNNDAAFASFFSVDGKDNGISAFFMKEIVMVEEDSEYLRALEKIAMPGEPISLVATDTSLRPLIEYAMDNKKIASLEISTSEDTPGIEITGLIQEVSDTTATIAEFNKNGKPDGSTTMYLADIHRVTIGSKTERRVAQLLRLWEGENG